MAVDPLLPARLRRLAFVVKNERLIARAWYRAAQRLTDFIRPTVMSPYDNSHGTVPPDPNTAFGTAAQSLWDREIDESVIPVVRDTLRTPWDSTLADGPPAVSQRFDQDPYITDYLSQSRNRLRNFPNELYAIVQRLIAHGLDQGSSIDDIATEIRMLLRATGNDTYARRAETVARTETIGATNAGAFASARVLAQEIGDTNPEKVWLATDDSRTRPTHVTAEGQRVPLTESFVVGGFPLQFPGDPTGPPQEVINCRCSFLHVVGGETLDWTDRQFRRNADDVWADYDIEQDLES